MARGLGKGINAFFPGLDTAKEEAIQEIPIKDCRPNPYQPRHTFNAEAIDELKKSIIEYGILQPLIIRKSIKGYEIVVGERRFRAAKEAGLQHIPAVVKELTDEKMMEIALLENLQREDLTPIEEARAYVNLMKELQLTQEQLGVRLGKSRPHIANQVRLLTLPEDIIELIDAGTLTMGQGRALLGLKDKKKMPAVAEKIQQEGLNVRQVEQLITRLNEGRSSEKSIKATKKDIFFEERESILREQLGTSVKIHKGKRKGKIEIDFFSEEDLERILEKFDS